jgi:hypothetical protein
MSVRLLFVLQLFIIASVVATATPDTVRVDNGVYGSTNPAREGWEESIIISPNTPCRIIGLMVYYGAGTGQDEIRITGDASEGTIPPTQYCFSYNTLGVASVTVDQPGWKTVMFNEQDIRIDGHERIVVQHVMSASGPRWGQDNNAQSPTTSYQYDPVSPNPNFFNIPGIYYLAKGDYMVRLIIDDKPAYRKPPTWVDVTAEAGLPSGTSALKTDQLSVVDWDNDGYDDFCVAGQFFRNKGNGTFEKITAPFNAGAPTAWADVDNDGDMDCFVAGGFTSERLWRNDGSGKFTDVTAPSGLSNNAPLVTALWLDIEHDGDLDLYLANGRSEANGNEVYFQDKLWRNDGNWKFTDVTTPSGIAKAEPAPHFDTWGASLADFNNDGFTDIFVATYRLAPDRLYRNNGDGTFTDVSKETGTQGIPTTQTQYFGHGMGSEWSDVNNDGNADLIVGNLGHPDSRAQYSNPTLMLLNGGQSNKWLFTNDYAWKNDVLTWHGIAFKEMNAGVCVADFNHDGLTDVWHGQISYEAFGSGANRPAHFYLNKPLDASGKRRFEDNTWKTGMFIHGAWTACRVDFDRDGDMDLLCASGTERIKLFRNDLAKTGSSITIRLNDVRAGKNTHAYGTRLRVYSGNTIQTRWMPGTVSGGRMSQMTHDLHVGLPSSSIDSIVVFWPGGHVTRHTDCLPGTVVRLSSDGKNVPMISNTRPAQISPSHGSLTDTVVTFRWVAAEPSVRIEIRQEGTSPSIILSETVTGNSLQYPLVRGRTYSWRVSSVSNNQLAQTPFWTFTVGAPRPNRVVILRPSSGSTDVPVTTDVWWGSSSFDMQDAVIPVRYHVVLTTQNAGSQPTPILDTVTASTSIEVSQLPANTPLACTITPVCQILEGITTLGDTSVSLFRTYDVPQAPSTIFPANNAESVTTRPRFQWSRPQVVDKGFELEVDTLASFATATLKRASDTSITWTPPLKAGRRYYWRARGNNLAGNGRWSISATFATAGTTGVAEEPVQSCEGCQIECYDLRGRLLAKGLLINRDEVTLGLQGMTIIVTRDARGQQCRIELLSY